MKKILVVDDDNDICLLLQKFLVKKGFDVQTATNGKEAVEWLKKNPTDLVICDFKLPDYNGLEILQKIKIIDAKIQVIIITGYSDVRIAVDALKKGAFDYVTKPLFPDEILMTINNALDAKPTPSKERKSEPTLFKREFISGVSQQSLLVQKHIDLIAPTEMSVIIQGETGTGKEYVAKSIHQKSTRSNHPFVAIDCGALPKDLAGSELFGHIKGAFTGAIQDKKGSFELANGGTLFLDEIGNLSYDNQMKMLRVLQERVVKKVGDTKDIPIDVRVVVASNENLQELTRKGEFREDLYHRLNEFKIELTPLRERPDDIEQFAHHFLNLANHQLDKNIKSIDQEVIVKLRSHYWHGNLRELNNVIKRSVLLCQKNFLDTSCLPPEIASPSANASLDMSVSFNGNIPSSLKEVVEEAEKKAILTVLKKTNNNKTKTAELLQVDRKTLYNKLKTYGLDS